MSTLVVVGYDDPYEAEEYWKAEGNRREDLEDLTAIP